VSGVVRVARFEEAGRPFHALLEDDGSIRPVPGDPWNGLGTPGPPRPVAGLTWLTPCSPSKIVCVGRNYHAHIAELKHEVPQEPLLFLKPPSALLPTGGVIRLPSLSRRVDYEGELGVVIGRPARRVPQGRALEHVLGLTCVNDVTARDLQERDGQWTRAKGFDTFAPVGPCLVLGLDPSTLRVETFVNGERRQSAPVSQMIFGLARLISDISMAMTLLPGDLISTGTPDGVGPLQDGDEVTVSIEGIGRLSNPVAAEEP